MSTPGTEARGHARLRLGTCPDSWGVWFADDPLQTPWDLFVVVEQEMYPTDFDKPKPIAQRTYTCLRGLGIGRE